MERRNAFNTFLNVKNGDFADKCEQSHIVCLRCRTSGPTYTELCESVHSAQRQIPTQIPIGFYSHLVGLGLCLYVCVGDLQCNVTK